MSIYPNTTTATLHLLLGYVAEGAMTATGTGLAVTTPGFFTSADVGARIMVLGASTLGAPLFTTIASFTDGENVDLTNPAATTVTATSQNVVIFREKNSATDSVVLVGAGGLTFTSTLQARDTFSFRYQSLHSSASPSTTFAPVEGQPVLLVDDNLGEIFGGLLDQVSLVNIPGDTGIYADCLGITYDVLLSKRTTGVPTGSGSPPQPNAGAFTSQTLGQIATYLVSLAADDGVTISTVTGPVIASYQVNYETLYNALDQVCQLASNAVAQYKWYTDSRRIVHVVQIGTVAAPWNLSYSDSSDKNALQLASGGSDGGIRVTFTKQNYANKVSVKIGTLTVGTTTETFAGDGALMQFETVQPVAAAPIIAIEISSPLSEIVQTVGVLGIDTGKQWYWNLGSNVITQDPSGTPLTTGESLVVTYQGADQGVVISANSAEIARRAAVEGGTGIYELVQDAGTPASLADAQTLAAALSNSLGVIPETVAYGIYRGGLQIGQTQRIDLLQMGVSDNFVIDSVTMSLQGNLVLWQITATRGPTVLNWQNMLQGSMKSAASGLGAAGQPLILAQPITSFTPVRAWVDEVADGPAVNNMNNTETVPFRYNNRLYFAGVFAGSNRYSVWRSEDDGRTWTELDSAHAPSGASITGTCIFDGATPANPGEGGYFLHCATVIVNAGTPPTENVFVQSFNLATELWGAASSTGPLAQTVASIFIRQNNTLFVTYDIGTVATPTTASRFRGATYNRSSNTWNPEVDVGLTLATAAGLGNNVSAASSCGVVDQATGRIHFFLASIAWDYFWWQAIESGDAVGFHFFFSATGAGVLPTYVGHGNAILLNGLLVVGIVTLDATIYNYRVVVSLGLDTSQLALATGWAISGVIAALSG